MREAACLLLIRRRSCAQACARTHAHMQRTGADAPESGKVAATATAEKVAIALRPMRSSPWGAATIRSASGFAREAGAAEGGAIGGANAPQ